MKMPTPPEPTSRTKVKRGDHDYWLNLMPASYMQRVHLAGFAKKGQAYISEDLGGRHKDFVINHEIYHLNDNRKWLGYFGMELRANVSCGLKDPIGLMATMFAGIKNGRLLAYTKALLGHSDWQ